MTPAEALETIRRLASAGLFIITFHAHARMRQRNILLRDVRCALTAALTCAPDGPKWQVTGPDFDGDALTCVVVIDGTVVMVTVEMANMNRCTKCGKLDLAKGKQPIQLDVGDRSFEGHVQGWACASCNELYYDGPDLGAFEEAAATWLAEHGVRTPEELKFMRKAAGIRAADLASWLGVTPETVSHWETGKHAPDVVMRSVIARIVVDTLRGESVTRDFLQVQGKPEGTRKVRLDRDAA